MPMPMPRQSREFAPANGKANTKGGKSSVCTSWWWWCWWGSHTHTHTHTHNKPHRNHKYVSTQRFSPWACLGFPLVAFKLQQQQQKPQNATIDRPRLCFLVLSNDHNLYACACVCLCVCVHTRWQFLAYQQKWWPKAGFIVLYSLDKQVLN